LTGRFKNKNKNVQAYKTVAKNKQKVSPWVWTCMNLEGDTYEIPFSWKKIKNRDDKREVEFHVRVAATKDFQRTTKIIQERFRKKEDHFSFHSLPPCHSHMHTQVSKIHALFSKRRDTSLGMSVLGITLHTIKWEQLVVIIIYKKINKKHFSINACFFTFLNIRGKKIAEKKSIQEREKLEW
jgi:hypothetical protein